jgi:hypothetical protein
MMQFAHSLLSQPHWVYHPGLAFEDLVRRRASSPRLGDPGFVRNGGLSAAIARSPDELRAATRLVESRYAERGYHLDADEDRLRPGVTLIAAHGDAITGTLTLRFDGPRGLAADESYGDAIDTVRHTGGDVCELTRLALTAGADSRSILSALFGSAYLVAKHARRATDVFVEVNPRHAAFYRKLFGFVVAAGQRVCPRVMAPAVLLRLEMKRLEARLAQSPALPRPLLRPVVGHPVA